MSNEEIVKEIDEATNLMTEAKVKMNIALNLARGVIMKGNTVDTEAYNKGLEDAKEVLHKVYDMKCDEIQKIFGVTGGFYEVIYYFSMQDIIAKLEAYEKEQNEMKVGDVVTVCGEKGIVVGYLCGLEEYEVWMDGYERPQRICKNEIKKTGKHIDIQSLLEQIKE